MTVTKSIKATSLKVVEGDLASINMEALEEYRVFLEERWDIEFSIAAFHGTTPPKKWVEEAREHHIRTISELSNRKGGE